MIIDFVLWWLDGIFECLIPGVRWRARPGAWADEGWQMDSYYLAWVEGGYHMAAALVDGKTE